MENDNFEDDNFEDDEDERDSSDDELDDIGYDDPPQSAYRSQTYQSSAYKPTVQPTSEPQTMDELMNMVDARARQTYHAEAIQEQNRQRLLKEYPDAVNESSPFYQKANEIFVRKFRSNPDYNELALFEARKALSAEQRTQPQPQQRRTPTTPNLTPRQQRLAAEWGRDPRRIAHMKTRRAY